MHNGVEKPAPNPSLKNQTRAYLCIQSLKLRVGEKTTKITINIQTSFSAFDVKSHSNEPLQCHTLMQKLTV